MPEDPKSPAHPTTRLAAVVPQAPPSDPRIEPGTTSPDLPNPPVEYDSSSAFAYLIAQNNEIAIAQRQTRDEVRSNHTETVARFVRLEHKVFGPNLPPLPHPNHFSIAAPAAPGSLPSLPPIAFVTSPPLTDRATQSERELEMLTQQLSNFQHETRKVLEAQSRVMGLNPEVRTDDTESEGRRARKRVVRRQGIKDAIALMTLIVAALGSVAAMMAQKSAEKNAGTAAAAAAAAPVVTPPATR